MSRPALQIIRDEHAAVAAVLRSLLQMMERAPDEQPERFFDVMRAMLFYIDEFPERRHHPKESDLLFPKVARVAPQLMAVIRRLEDDHLQGEDRVRELQHLLLAWELLGDSRRAAFQEAARAYVEFYLSHMRVEETEILPTAIRLLPDEDWAQLDEAFAQHRDPMATGSHDPVYDRLFTRIVMRTPAPIGVGPAF
ncbi:hemerythrin domain-containing protein [Ramlibacter alkalitolerans]|uniref:Hemerythrin domain-containing protein n=1 Tax=Ramlibacter alkalitolerans TaxID=2039631 RepID=A0ABS1JN36_9BURK|nr:hemerythrin domain-containing protein [Ramlibacter alkalitolerans]MBL0425667.1 hemerythrin domain-containing protein [Ramlibacter alkalitolerans]